MLLTSERPSNWIDLQNLVCKYLRQAGYEAESPKTINTVRGEVEVDVFASAKNELIRYFVCECKYWNTPVPKEKIHAFRTVVQDTGATLGIFISKEGYQSGAIEAAQYSNVVLKTWDSFLDMIRDQWLLRRLIAFKHTIHPLSVYTDFLDVPIDKLTPDERVEYEKITKSALSTYIFAASINQDLLSQQEIEYDGEHFCCCNDLLVFLEKKSMHAIQKYQDLFRNYTIDSYKFETGGYMLFPLMEGIYQNGID